MSDRKLPGEWNGVTAGSDQEARNQPVAHCSLAGRNRLYCCRCIGLLAALWLRKHVFAYRVPGPDFHSRAVGSHRFPTNGFVSILAHAPFAGPDGAAVFAWIIVFVVLLVLLVLVKQSERFSREWLAIWFALQATFLMLMRLGVFGGLRWLRNRGYNLRNVVLIGNSPQAHALIRHATRAQSSGFVVAAIFNNEDKIADDVEGHYLRPLRDLKEHLATCTVDEIWVVLPLEQSQRLRTVLSQCDGATANVRYVPDLQDIYLLNHGITEILGTPMIDLHASPMQGNGRLVKAFEDRLLAVLILTLISPLMMLIAIGVKLTSRGPVLYRQVRNGWDGREIAVYKFRTMRAHREVPGCVTQASPEDERVTRFGAFLRRTSLDELPQFINVLQGRMSVVGPRPHAVEHNVQYRKIIDRYALRHIVKPGITGWAQVNGLRGMTETSDKMQLRVDYDLFYINNWSVWLDLKIIFLTVLKGFVNKNAY